MLTNNILLFTLATMVVCRPVRRQDDCADLQVLYVPGTSETDLADTGNALKTALLDFMPEATVEALIYDTAPEYIITVAAGAAKAEDWLRSKASACPAAYFAPAGYSKGAMVVHEVTSPSQRIKDKTVAVAVFGDPYTKDTGIVSALTGGIFEDLTNNYPVNNVSTQTIAFCNGGDPFCDGGFNIEAHLAYDTDGSANKAASFIVDRYQVTKSSV